MDKNNIPKIEKVLKKEKLVALVAPSFIVDFEYPTILHQLQDLGFDKAVELTFGAKMINRDYHDQLAKSKKLLIASPCPGIVDVVKKRYPKYAKNLAKIDSPMEAMGKICRKAYPKHKLVFISPCDYKKIEVQKSKNVDYVIDYNQLRELFKKYKIKKKKGKKLFDKFYNDFTKIYPLSGGLAKTAHLRGVIKKNEIKTIDGIKKAMEFLDKPDPKIRFLDILYCTGGCIGGPHTNKNISIPKKRKKIMEYLTRSKREKVPESRKGIIEKAKGIKFTHK
jgi:iron only hydrogenase large subunit-like protein